MLKILTITVLFCLMNIAVSGVDQGNPKRFVNTTFGYGFKYNSSEFNLDSRQSDFVKLVASDSTVVMSIQTVPSKLTNPLTIRLSQDVKNCTLGKVNGFEGFICYNRYILLVPGKFIFILNFIPQEQIRKIISSFKPEKIIADCDATDINSPIRKMIMTENKGRILLLAIQAPDDEETTVLKIVDSSPGVVKYAAQSEEDDGVLILTKNASGDILSLVSNDPSLEAWNFLCRKLE